MEVPADIAVWFSNGAPSAVAAKLTVERYGWSHTVHILNNPVIEEPADNLRFQAEVAEWIGRPVQRVTHPDYPNCSAEEIWEKRKYMGGVLGAPCTMILKRQAREAWEIKNPVGWHVLGFTLEEQVRHNRFVLTERDNVLPILIEEKLTRQDCFDILSDAGIRVSQAYFQGYANANCTGCIKAKSPTYWNLVRVTDPDVFLRRAELSRRLGVRLAIHKGKRIFLDELPEDAVGRPLKSMKAPDCGSFCEEWKK